jgi:hypothetical protein
MDIVSITDTNTEKTREHVVVSWYIGSNKCVLANKEQTDQLFVDIVTWEGAYLQPYEALKS